MQRVLHRPFTTMVDTMIRSTSNKLKAISLASKKIKPQRLSTEGILKRKILSIYQSYFVSPRVLFYGEMLFIRAKLQFYRINQIKAVKWFTKSFKRNYGLYIFGAFFVAYFGQLR